MTLAVRSGTAQAASHLLIFGGDDNREFLGCLTCNEFSGESVWSQVSRYSWDASAIGVWSTIGRYRSSISSYSACNQFATHAPVIVDTDGNFYWRLTLNQFTTKSVCTAIGGNNEICEALKKVCQDE